MNITDFITSCKSENRKLFAILIDPDKLTPELLASNIKHLDNNKPDLILVGGSLINNNLFKTAVESLKQLNIPVVIFPGNNQQISEHADGILLLSLISGRNPDYLIGQHVNSSFQLRASGIEVIPTGYILIDCGTTTSVSYISNTTPIPYTKNGIVAATALAGEQLGLKIIYLDGGSGAAKPIAASTIKAVRQTIDSPVIVGGGISSAQQVKSAWENGADMVVIGTAFEKDPHFLESISRLKNEHLWK